MNNFIKIEKQTGHILTAFIYNGWTFEKQGDWISVKTCTDPSVLFQIEKRGIEVTELGLKVLAKQVLDELKKQTQSLGL